MPLTDSQLNEIESRNHERKQLKDAASPMPWEYDSFGFIHQSVSVKPGKRIGILLRPMVWFHALQKRYGSDFFDTGFSQLNFIQAYHDADYIIKERNGAAEKDIELLAEEVRRLRATR